MTTATPAPEVPAVPQFHSTAAGAGRVTFPRVVASEWVKLRSLRSTYFTLLAALVFLIGFGLLITSVTANRWPRMRLEERLNFNAANDSLNGFFLAQLAVGVLGVLIVTGEYATGSIRATMSAAPRRLGVLWAKTLVYCTVVLVLMTVAAVVAFLCGQAVLSQRHIGVSFSDGGVPRVVFGCAVYLTVVGALAIGLGALVRNTAGGIASLFGLLLVLPALARALPQSWQDHIIKYLPSEAGQTFFKWHHENGQLSPGSGLLVLCLYAAVALGTAAALLKRRDV